MTKPEIAWLNVPKNNIYDGNKLQHYFDLIEPDHFVVNFDYTPSPMLVKLQERINKVWALRLWPHTMSRQTSLKYIRRNRK